MTGRKVGDEEGKKGNPLGDSGFPGVLLEMEKE